MDRRNIAASILGVEPDFFFPATFDLSNGPVVAVRTGPVPPQVVFDSTGLWAKDPTGAYVFQVKSADGSAYFEGPVAAGGLNLQTTPGPGIAGFNKSKIQWVDTVRGVVADVSYLFQSGTEQVSVNVADEDPASGPTGAASLILQARRQIAPDIAMALLSLVGDDGSSIQNVKLLDSQAHSDYSAHLDSGDSGIWHSLAPLNGWVNYPLASYPKRSPLQVTKDAAGWCTIRGYLDSLNATSQIICNLPTGYAPTQYDQSFATVSWLSPSWSTARFVIQQDGTVRGYGSADTVPSGRRDFPINARWRTLAGTD